MKDLGGKKVKRANKKDPVPFPYSVGDKLKCASFRELKSYALEISSLGYGVAVLGFSDMSDNVLTITAAPGGGEGEDH